MAYQAVFKRYEIKYLMTLRQAENLKRIMNGHMTGDRFGNSTICNIYLDTPDYLLIRRSLDKPVYKEKLRFRSYGVAKRESEVFCELKKKYNGIVYKRRLSMREAELNDCVSRGCFPDTQIGKEISFCFTRYPMLLPKVFLSYEREAFYAKDDDSFRMTFDKNILWRDYDLSLNKGVYGNNVLGFDDVLVEVKTAGGIPLWLVKFLSDNKIYKTSFSKYGRAYAQLTGEAAKGGSISA